MERRKIRNILIGCVVAGLLLFVIFLHLRDASQKRIAASQRKPGQSDQRVRIEGLRFFGVHAGRKVIAVEADLFAIEKKRIGFFRFALADTVRIENGRLVIYAEPDGLAETGRSVSRNQRRSTGPLRFPHVFTDETLKMLPVPLSKKIASIEVAPISVKIMKGDSPITTITASAAEIRLRNRDVRFEGNVRVIAGGKTLNTDQLTFDPESGILKTDHSFSMKSGNETTSGKHLQTDIFLRPISTDNPVKKP